MGLAKGRAQSRMGMRRFGELVPYDTEYIRPIIREGTIANRDPNASKPKFFRVVVNAAGYSEDWIEGMDVYHNPNADIPFPPELLVKASHHFLLEDGQVETRKSAEFHPLGSITKHVVRVDVQEFL